MQNYILCFDPIGNTNSELVKTMKDLDIIVINVINVENIIVRSNELNNKLGLIIWCIYNEEKSVFNDILKFKSIESFKHIPIIVISNFGNNGVVLKAVQSGVSDFILKPYNPDLLKSKLLDIMNLKSKSKNSDLDVINKKVEFSLKKILSMQIKGATRGRYELSMILFSIMKSKEVSNEIRARNTVTIKKILEKKARETDLLIECSNSNLLIILPYTNQDGMKTFYNKVIDCIEGSTILKNEAGGTIISSSYETINNDYTNNKEDIILKKLQSKLRVCIIIPKKS